MCYDMAKFRTSENFKIFEVPMKKLFGFSFMTVNVTGDRKNMRFAWVAVMQGGIVVLYNDQAAMLRDCHSSLSLF